MRSNSTYNRGLLAKLPRIDTWKGFALGALALAIVAAGIEFMHGTGGDSAPRALLSLEFGFMLVLASLLVAFAVWAVIRVARRESGQHPGKEGVLFYACILTTLVSGARLIS